MIDKNNRERKRNPRYMGYINKWNYGNNFGFITCYEDGKSYYCNLKMVQDGVCLERGTVVEFEIWHNREDEEQKFAAKVLVVEAPERKRGKY